MSVNFEPIIANKDAVKCIKEFNNSFSQPLAMPLEAIKAYMRKIIIDEQLVGFVGFSEYKENGSNALGIGNFFIFEKGKGYGTAALKALVEQYKDKYDLIYCFVDKNNKEAVNLYKKLGKVYDDTISQNGEHYVVFYSKNPIEEDLKDEAKKHFGTTWDWKKTFYINTDGTLLDGSGVKLGANGHHRTIDHREISDILADIDSTEAMLTYMREGNIRFIPEIPGIDLIVEPTEAQYKKLSELFATIHDNISVDFSSNDGSYIESKDFDLPTERHLAIFEIKNHFNNALNEVYPNKGENKEDFISRFMSVTKDEYPDIKQRFAVANSYWDRRNLKESSENNISEFIINPEDNIKLAKEIAEIVNKNKLPRGVRMKRDNCRLINENLLKDLKLKNYQPKLVNGYFIVDNLNIVDEQDLEYLGHYLSWKDSGLSIREYVEKNNLLGKDFGWYTYVPHWWLELDNLIIDRALPMFYHALEKPVDKQNYTFKDYNESFNKNGLVRDYRVIKAEFGAHKLTEDTRNQLIASSRNAGPYKDQSKGKNRFERKRLSKIANQVKNYNEINMNSLFKEDTLEVKVPVIGEKGNYNVTIRFNGVVDEIRKNIIANKYKLEYRTYIQALVKVFNSANVYMHCDCDDWRYNFAYWSIVNHYSTEGNEDNPGPGKGIANPDNSKGKGCKHALLVISNTDWLLKLASVLKNYVNYTQEHMKAAFDKIIFPKLYGITPEEAKEKDIIPEDIKLETEKHIIDKINDFAKTRGLFKKGSNKNSAAGKGNIDFSNIKKSEDTDKKVEEK